MKKLFFPIALASALHSNDGGRPKRIRRILEARRNAKFSYAEKPDVCRCVEKEYVFVQDMAVNGCTSVKADGTRPTR